MTCLTQTGGKKRGFQLIYGLFYSEKLTNKSNTGRQNATLLKGNTQYFEFKKVALRVSQTEIGKKKKRVFKKKS